MKDEEQSVRIEKKDGLSQDAQEAIEHQQTMKKESLEEERKRKIKAAVKSFFGQAKVGCSKDICFNKWCYKNPFGKDTISY